MNDADKTKTQLIEEMLTLRQRVNELELAANQRQQVEASLESQVQERTNQLQQALEFDTMLKCITDKVRDSLDESQILQTVVQEPAIPNSNFDNRDSQPGG